MARRKYTITPEDQGAALAYLANKLRESNWPSEDTSTEIKAEKSFIAAKRELVTLNKWCEKWLNSAQWEQLKNAIRAARKRVANKGRDSAKTITLTHSAWLIIHELAKRDKLTLSALIENRLGREYSKH